MRILQWLQRIRKWVPVPNHEGKLALGRWILLDGNRSAVALVLLLFVYASLMVIGALWSFQMQVLLTETSTVENILETFLSGIILLVSVVVSINSIVLSQDMTAVNEQENRIRGVGEFWRDVHDLSETSESPSDLQSFLEVITSIIKQNAEALGDTTDELEPDLAAEVEEYSTSVSETVDQLQDIQDLQGADLYLLWISLEMEYGSVLDQTHVLRSKCSDSQPQACKSSLDSLLEAFQLFAVGREYFKTMYYSREVARLSRTLLVVSLPAIIITASAILGISAGLFPDYWILGLPPLHSFVATTFAIALIPYIVLTSFILRLSTVAKRTITEGLVSMR